MFNKNKLLMSPCKDCTSRTAGCHSNCSKYESYKIKLQMIKDQIKKEKFLILQEEGKKWINL